DLNRDILAETSLQEKFSRLAQYQVTPETKFCGVGETRFALCHRGLKNSLFLIIYKCFQN
ncbi:hypothetical protein ACFLZB_04220, partial [Nanoarchaeota archaeon]